MKTAFQDSFANDLASLRDGSLLKRIKKVVEQVEVAQSLQQIPNLKRLETKQKFYRLRVGDYRLGCLLDDGVVIFVRCLHRREIYRYFP